MGEDLSIYYQSQMVRLFSFPSPYEMVKPADLIRRSRWGKMRSEYPLISK